MNNPNISEIPARILMEGLDFITANLSGARNAGAIIAPAVVALGLTLSPSTQPFTPALYQTHTASNEPVNKSAAAPVAEVTAVRDFKRPAAPVKTTTLDI